VTLHRIPLPETLGVASIEALSRALGTAADAADPSSEVSAWVLEGAGQGTFCRGMDHASLLAEGASPHAGLDRFAACLTRVRNAPRPTIALVDGAALGGGLGLMAACDLVLATEGSTFALPEALFGLLPGAVMPALLERLAPQKARLMVLRGRAESAAWAMQVGLVDAIVPAGSLEASALRAARELSRVASERVRGLRQWVHQIPGLEADAAVARGGAITAALLDDARVRAGLRAFVEDGTPPWTAR
jgi:methylglutaconyl-CoA hydratase/polyketide biosynthesis enoyl-CoA hydratase PksH